MGKYFGTDGFRGEAGITLTADHAYKVGRFLGWYYNAVRERNGNNESARIVIGKDTRRSSYMFEYSLVAGLTASGADAYLLHVTTTPSVAYIARVDDFDCGIMISASHNPYYDNGIKLIDCYGEKMPEEILLLVEDYIDGKLHVFDKDWPELPFAHREHIGCTVDYVAGRNRYMGYLISLGIYSFKGVKVGLDCANGASWNIAKSVFDALGADTYVINAQPNGTNINNNAGSTHIEGLQKFVVEKGLDIGFAYDGDADRCLCVDEKGNVITGDHILYIYGCYMKERGKLLTNTAMVMSGSMSSLMQGMLVPLCTYSIVAIGLNLCVGYLGELSLGHAGFMCVGAFSSAFFTKCMEDSSMNPTVRFIIALLIGIVFAAFFGFLIGIPVLRLRGDYLAIVTLAFGEIIKNVMNVLYVGRDSKGFHFSIKDATALNMDTDGELIVNGAKGITGTPHQSTFTIGVILIILSLIVVYNLVNSRSGRAIMAIRDNRIAAESIGINITKYKILAFSISAALAGAAGVLYAHNLSTLTALPKNFGYNMSITILVFVVLGGIGNIRGSVIAAVVLTLLPELLRFLSDYRMLIYAVVLIVTMILVWSPGGIAFRERLENMNPFRKKEKEVQ